jgi:hypothetical protein
MSYRYQVVKQEVLIGLEPPAYAPRWFILDTTTHTVSSDSLSTAVAADIACARLNAPRPSHEDGKFNPETDDFDDIVDGPGTFGDRRA